MLKLGLIGEGIGQSQSPDLHHRLGELTGIATRYDLFDAAGTARFDFDASVARLCRDGYRGVNVTYPFKERALRLADTAGEGAARVGSANTLLFETGGIRAENTDYTGFVSAYHNRFGDRPAGRVLLIGAGGVGRAVACGLDRVGLSELLIAERDAERGRGLVADLLKLGLSARFIAADTTATELAACDGLVNCTPVGHRNHPGCPVDTANLGPAHWVFDAVYIPARTELLRAAEAAGASTLTGVDLFAFQGIDAFRFFAADRVEAARLDQAAHGIRDHYYRTLVLGNG